MLEYQAALPLLKLQIKFFFQYACVRLIEDIKLLALSCVMNYCTVAVKLLLNIPAFRLFDEIFLVVMLIWLFNWIFLHY